MPGKQLRNSQATANGGERAAEVVADPMLGELMIETKISRFRFKLAAIGTLGKLGGTISILSTVGSETAIKALRACLSKAAKTDFRADCEGFNPNRDLKVCDLGYRFYLAPLGSGTWHSMALAKMPGLICKLNDDSLWRELQRNCFTTPVLQKWVPWLRAEMEERGHLQMLHSFQCEGAVLNLTTEMLDELVSHGLRRKRIII